MCVREDDHVMRRALMAEDEMVAKGDMEEASGGKITQAGLNREDLLC